MQHGLRFQNFIPFPHVGSAVYMQNENLLKK